MARTRASVFVASAYLVVMVLTAAPVAAQPATAVLRTPYGDPDIQGNFTFRTLTPLQRPVIDEGASANLAGKDALTAEEAAAYEASRRRELNRDSQNLQVHAPGVRYQSLAEGGVGGYNEFWYERGIELTADRRTSLIIDPPDGRLPPRTEAARQRGRQQPVNAIARSYESHETRSLMDRCIMGFNSGPPMTSSAYNNNVMIFQSPGYVVVLNEMVHNARVIPLTDTDNDIEKPTFPQFAGVSRGHFEGATLVVETTQFRGGESQGTSPNKHLIERFTRFDSNTVAYEFTVTDPTVYTAPYTALMPLRRTDGPMFEYACHEGNIGLAGILAGAREQERLGIELRR
ncbi:MAG: hypothetical protein QGI10_13960 [Vicinamibacterales bacterium]|jgi:hypothetical protein|nr:hypothetical protein [Vicinamibacterales bacterium]MDP7480368.1 hypothetical protein [Vicinamibacterales bacterium]HJN43151.1 hypothetical protein [Vicinamibacterales bacterium]